MRVLLVTKGFPPRVGGVETLCRQLAAGLAERGEEVTVLTYRGLRARPQTATGGGVRVSAPAGYRVLEVPSLGGEFEWSWRLVPVLRRLAFDVCHVHNLHATVALGAWAARRRPYVLTGHYHGAGHSAAARLLHPAYRVLARRIVASAAAVTAVSASEAALLRRDFGRDLPGEPEIIPNGIPAGRVAPRAAPAGPPTIVAVSRLVAYKRVDAVVRALPQLPGFRLHVIGDGPERAALARLAGILGVGERVRIDSSRPTDAEVLAALAGAAVHVNLSEAEAFSYTVLESLAAGTPVVTSDRGALTEWSARFPAAVHAVDPGQPGEVARAIGQLAGRRAAVDLDAYTLPAILDRYQQVYARVAA